jgi:hypothetical protein
MHVGEGEAIVPTSNTFILIKGSPACESQNLDWKNDTSIKF